MYAAEPIVREVPIVMVLPPPADAVPEYADCEVSQKPEQSIAMLF
jgi:hypothetical protein